MSDPNVMLDGNWTQALRCGQATILYPFQSLGDVTTRIIRQPFQQDLRNRVPMSPGLQNDDPDNASYNTAYAYDDSEPQDLGAHLGRWIRSYADLPANPITTYESYPFAFQKYTTSTTTGSSSTYSISLTSTSISVTSRVVRTYFLAANIASFPLRNPTRMEQANQYVVQKIGPGSLYASTVIQGVFVSDDGANFLAEADKYEIWHYPIMCVVSRYINAPTNTFWGNAYNLTTFSVSPASATISEEVTLTMTGVNTAWTSATTFGCSAGSVNTNSVDVSAQTATVTFTAPTSAQTVRFAASDNSLSTNGVVVTTS